MLLGHVMAGIQKNSFYKSLGLTHTSVTHKQPGPEYTKYQDVTWPDGTVERRAGGTQKCDGFFAGFRDAVGRYPLSTSRMAKLHERLRIFQWKYEHLGDDVFLAFGDICRLSLE